MPSFQPSPVALRCPPCRAQRATHRRVVGMGLSVVVALAALAVSTGSMSRTLGGLIAVGAVAGIGWVLTRRERVQELDILGRFAVEELMERAGTDATGRTAVAATQALRDARRDAEAIALARRAREAALRAKASPEIRAELAHELARCLVDHALEAGSVEQLDGDALQELERTSAEAARVFPRSSSVLDTRALALVIQGHHGQAKALFERALDGAERPVERATLTAHLALAQGRSGHLANARALLLEARRIDPGCSAVMVITRLLAEAEVRHLLGQLWLPAASNDEARTAKLLRSANPSQLAQLLVAVGTFLRTDWPASEKARVVREELPDRTFSSDRQALCFLDDLGAGLASLAPRRVVAPKPQPIRAGHPLPIPAPVRTNS